MVGAALYFGDQLDGGFWVGGAQSSGVDGQAMAGDHWPVN